MVVAAVVVVGDKLTRGMGERPDETKEVDTECGSSGRSIRGALVVMPAEVRDAVVVVVVVV